MNRIVLKTKTRITHGEQHLRCKTCMTIDRDRYRAYKLQYRRRGGTESIVADTEFEVVGTVGRCPTADGLRHRSSS